MCSPLEVATISYFRINNVVSRSSLIVIFYVANQSLDAVQPLIRGNICGPNGFPAEIMILYQISMSSVVVFCRSTVAPIRARVGQA